MTRLPAALATRDNVAGQTARDVRAVVPVVRAGLHCGARTAVSASARAVVVPVVRTGLHCGRWGTSNITPVDVRSSPSSGRVSIAVRGCLREQGFTRGAGSAHHIAFRKSGV